MVQNPTWLDEFFKGQPFDIVYRVTGSVAPGDQANVLVSFRALSGTATLTLLNSPLVGQRIAVLDEDGSLASFDITLNGNGNTINGASTQSLHALGCGPR